MVTEIQRTEVLAPQPASALATLLDLPAPTEEVPLLWHWLHLLERPAQVDLGADGHPVRHTIPAPPGSRRRMWAGGRVDVHRPLRYLEEATRLTTVASTTEKVGASGPLTFVTVRHELRQGGQLAIEEEQDIVYRLPGPPNPSAALPPGGDEPQTSDDWRLQTSPTLLFRFSALTYNAHRIHYDRDYARHVEGYPGLVVHGPLQALLMAEAIRKHLPSPGPSVGFDYRLVSAVYDEEDLLIATSAEEDGRSARVRSGSGRLSAVGRLRAR